ncbi:hypothetical protein TOT_010000407 [Theileria orientalis strain Shintoku]|uniref:Uncharacterized protein n=1 Tax=Theileria orientalis strain Shintoku TaxID=869250 RepID=J4CC83_THEOR|nr:hypothetical protein TOT_010000407 [Theileria orientalis strain Shintoku]PVC53168.1 hypothetical protein MACL_00000230 [Theileria orientalis]BAM38942.1 hypothetical protein TOT_010000407 [Theileria orientalis strain Shintoku]|eukprot:XP_009689243.1 hypothetical protein TOT_010000407 [Theileria orientalis strain Shintoku]
MELVVKLSGHQHHQLEGARCSTNLVFHSSTLCSTSLYWFILYFSTPHDCLWLFAAFLPATHFVGQCSRSM